MLDSMCSALLPASAGMSILGEHPLLERLDRGVGLGFGLGPPPYPPLPPRLWRPTLWGSPPPPPCPPPPVTVPALPLCPEPCHLPALARVGVSHLFDYMSSARLWYPWYYKGDSVFSGASALDVYDVGSKELPSRALKQDRLKERQDLAHALHIDKDHAAAINARKTASTQTQFSSFNGEAPPYPGPPPAYFAPRGEPHPGDGYSPVHHAYGPPPPLASTTPHSTTNLSSPSSLSPPASGHLVDLTHAHVGQADIQNAPLNLSLSSSPSSVSASLASARQLARPTVITCTSSSSSSPVSSGGSSPRGQNGHSQHSPSATSSQPVSDPAIEEHFRRSLGKSYGDSIPKTTAVTSSVQANVSITGSVDDHFAKALGDSTWKAIKSQNDPPLDVFTGSVDDHFAKALGATTWRRIKAETEISENSSANNNNNNSTTSSASATASPHSGSSLSTPVAT